nr:rhomboid-related protein 1 [Halyomorpha halys]XP_014290354.1 rhomboid-related protein 1 [Halyomorpha halys]
MDYKGEPIGLEVIDEEKTYALEDGRVSRECNKFRNIKKTVISIIFNAPFTISCCIIQVICYCLENEHLLDLMCFAPGERDQLWRAVTYAFLHSNLYHLIPNLLFLLLVGILTEHDQGSLRAFIVYATGIVSGAFGCNFSHRQEKVIGTSAASYSMLLSHVLHIKLNWKTVRYKDYRMIIVFCLCFSDIVSFILCSIFFQNVFVSWSSHFFSSINGLFISAIIFRSNRPCHLFRYFSISVYTALMTYSLVVYVPWIVNNTCKYSSYNSLNLQLKSTKNIQNISVPHTIHRNV